ncbi:MAG: ribosome silencing factor [Acidimicrobiales bacterium]
MSPATPTTVATTGPPVIPDIALVAARAADDKLGGDTVVLAMGELLGVVDAFVVTSARTDRQVRALVEEVEQQVKDHDGTAPIAVEGLSDASWVLMDYGDLVVHVFAEQTRGYYDLEHLWSSAPRIAWQDERDVRGAARVN